MLICELDEVPEGDARGFVVDTAGEAGEARADESGGDDAPAERAAARRRAALRVIVVRRAGAVFVYENRCPHRGTPLDWAPDRFLDSEGEHLMCATHGALFRVEDGHCLAGPCAGDALRPLNFELRGGQIVLADRPAG
jgi:nitrite reductase/ring-hydroxylating ferredoxin subunit